MPVGERRVVGRRRRPPFGDVGVHGGEQRAERVGVALDVSAGEGARRRPLGREQRRVLLDDLVGSPAVADPQVVGVVGRPRQRRLVTVDLPRQAVAAAGRDLADRAHAARAAVEAQQQPGGVVALHPLAHPRDAVADTGGGERLDLAGRAATLLDERVQVGADLDDALAADELDEVEPVRADVGDGTEVALAGGVEPPVPVGVEQQPVLQVVAADQPRLADRAGADEGGGVLVVRVVAEVEAHGVDDAGVAGAGDEVAGLGAVDAERLLADDVFAGGRSPPLPGWRGRRSGW